MCAHRVYGESTYGRNSPSETDQRILTDRHTDVFHTIHKKAANCTIVMHIESTADVTKKMYCSLYQSLSCVCCNTDTDDNDIRQCPDCDTSREGDDYSGELLTPSKFSGHRIIGQRCEGLSNKENEYRCQDRLARRLASCYMVCYRLK